MTAPLTSHLKYTHKNIPFIQSERVFIRSIFIVNLSVAEDSDDEEWAEETQETAEIEPQLSSMTLSSNTSERSHEEKLEMFYNFVEVRNLNLVQSDTSGCQDVSLRQIT